MIDASDVLIDAQERVIDAQEREIKKLESENASLRGAAQGLGELCDKYKAENAKLRKYLKDTWESCTDCDEDVCSYSDAHCRNIGGTCWLYECIKGMGIEVE